MHELRSRGGHEVAIPGTAVTGGRMRPPATRAHRIRPVSVGVRPSHAGSRSLPRNGLVSRVVGQGSRKLSRQAATRTRLVDTAGAAVGRASEVGVWTVPRGSPAPQKHSQGIVLCVLCQEKNAAECNSLVALVRTIL